MWQSDVDLLLWLEKFEDAFAYGRYGVMDDKLKQQKAKATMLIHRLKDPAKSIVTAGLSSSQLENFNVLKERLKQNYVNFETASYARANINSANMEEDEDVQVYASRLSRLIDRNYYCLQKCY